MIELKSPFNFMGSLIDAGTKINLPPEIAEKLIESGAAKLIKDIIIDVPPKEPPAKEVSEEIPPAEAPSGDQEPPAEDSSKDKGEEPKESEKEKKASEDSGEEERNPQEPANIGRKTVGSKGK